MGEKRTRSLRPMVVAVPLMGTVAVTPKLMTMGVQAGHSGGALWLSIWKASMTARPFRPWEPMASPLK